MCNPNVNNKTTFRFLCHHLKCEPVKGDKAALRPQPDPAGKRNQSLMPKRTFGANGQIFQGRFQKCKYTFPSFFYLRVEVAGFIHQFAQPSL